MDAGIVKSNPFARRGTFKEEAKGKYIPESEFRSILPFLPDYLKQFVVSAYFTGMRRGELVELTCDRVNLSEGYIDLTPDDTKTEEPRRIYFNSIPELKEIITDAVLKCKRSNDYVFRKPDGSQTEEPRRIYFNSIPELKEIITDAVLKCKRSNDYVFRKPDGSQIPKWYIQRLFKNACKKAGVQHYRLHDLRHTFNTNMLKAGVSQTVIMKLTGHKTNEMFLRYSHIDKEQGESAMKKLDKFLAEVD